MPNWCENTLEIKARTPEAMEAFLSACEGDDVPFCFNSLVPCPEDLLNTQDRYVWSMDPQVHEHIVRKHAEEQKWGYSEEQLQEKCRQDAAYIIHLRNNLKKYGYKHWYDWRCSNWGTKWDLNADTIIRKNGKRKATVSFQTAWAPPLAWLEKVAPRFPDIKFLLTYEEEGNQSSGCAYFFRDRDFIEDLACLSDLKTLYKSNDWE